LTFSHYPLRAGCSSLPGMGNQVLVELREHLGITQAQLGKPVDLLASHVSSIERGTRPIGANVGLRIWDHYKRDLAYLGHDFEALIRGGSGRKSA